MTDKDKAATAMLAALNMAETEQMHTYKRAETEYNAEQAGAVLTAIRAAIAQAKAAGI